MINTLIFYTSLFGNHIPSHLPATAEVRRCQLLLLNSSELFDRLLDCGEDTIIAFRDPNICGKLSIEDMFKVIGKHFSLAKSALNKLKSELDGHELTALGENHPVLARAILDSKECVAKLSRWDLTLLCSSDEDLAILTFCVRDDVPLLQNISVPTMAEKYAKLARLIMRNPEHFSRFTPFPWVCMGRWHEDVALEMLYNEHITNHLNGYFLSVLCECQPVVALRLLTDHTLSHLRSKLGSRELTHVGRQSYAVAAYIFHNPGLLSLVEDTDLAVMVAAYEDLALAVLNNQALSMYLGSSSLGLLCSVHESVARAVFDIDRFYERLNLYEIANIASKYPMLAKRVLSDPELRGRIDLSILGKYKEEIAFEILKDEELCNQLNGTVLAELGVGNPTVARYILDKEMLYQKLEGEDITWLCKNTSLAIEVLRNPYFFEKMDRDDLLELAQTIPDAALCIIKNLTLRNKVGIENLYTISKGYPACAEALLKTEMAFGLTVKRMYKLQRVISKWENLQNLFKPSLEQVFNRTLRLT